MTLRSAGWLFASGWSVRDVNTARRLFPSKVERNRVFVDIPDDIALDSALRAAQFMEAAHRANVVAAMNAEGERLADES